jgi:ATP-binding cassette subfamily B protein
LARENTSGTDNEARYYRAIARAVAALDPNTADSRRALYKRAHKLLIDQLTSNNSLAGGAKSKHEYLAFKDAVRRVESEAVRRETAARQKGCPRPAPGTVNNHQKRSSTVEGQDSVNSSVTTTSAKKAAGPSKTSSLRDIVRAAFKFGFRNRTRRRKQPPAVRVTAASDISSAQKLQGECESPESLFAVPPPSEQLTASRNDLLRPPLQAMIQAARYHGVELDINEFRNAPAATAPTAVALAQWAQNAGMWARAVQIGWRHLLRLHNDGPVVLLFKDGSAGLLTGANADQRVVLLKDPYAPAGSAAVAVDELRLSQVWAGEAVLLRASRGYVAADALFNFRWLLDLVLQERRSLRDIALASFSISFLTIFPPLLVMATVNRVLQFHSMSTLVLLSMMMAIIVFYETLLGYSRRLIVAVVGARLDAKLNLHVFNRLLRLPLDYFERHPAGETMYRIAQVYRVREFLTGRLLTTFLDLITLCVLLPILFYLNAILAWIVLACAGVITLIILAHLKPLRDMYSRVAIAETWKSATIGETIVGIKTVKALALEPQRKAVWDERVAETGKWRLAFARLGNWPQTLVNPFERLMVLGTMLIGAYIAMNDPSGYLVGGLFAFMMLGQRVAQPLVGLARLIEDYEEVGAAIGEAGSVLNRPLETAANTVGLRPKFVGAISFQDVTFTYSNTKVPALDRVSFSVPAGTMLGVVGRSGSGKSTITRLLQGINRDYQGFIKIDGSDLREIDLRHLRQSLGVVLQDNFLFRGSVRDNIIAGRPGLTMTDAVQAARLAGAEEFIEQMPNGYETYIEEGSPNLSGGQRQRLAIARALIRDPRILILDEATSALDPESETVVTANLVRIAQGRTMVIVSHRLSSLVECDQTLVMDQGKVVDVAPHSVLLDRCAIYRQLWAQQNRHLDGASVRTIGPRLVTGGLAQS